MSGYRHPRGPKIRNGGRHRPLKSEYAVETGSANTRLDAPENRFPARLEPVFENVLAFPVFRNIFRAYFFFFLMKDTPP